MGWEWSALDDWKLVYVAECVENKLLAGKCPHSLDGFGFVTNRTQLGITVDFAICMLLHDPEYQRSEKHDVWRCSKEYVHPGWLPRRMITARRNVNSFEGRELVWYWMKRVEEEEEVMRNFEGVTPIPAQLKWKRQTFEERFQAFARSGRMAAEFRSGFESFYGK